MEYFAMDCIFKYNIVEKKHSYWVNNLVFMKQNSNHHVSKIDNMIPTMMTHVKQSTVVSLHLEVDH